MERTNHISNPSSVSELAGQTESALNELDSLRKRSTLMLFFPDKPEAGDSVYDEANDINYIYNSIQSEWKAH